MFDDEFDEDVKKEYHYFLHELPFNIVKILSEEKCTVKELDKKLKNQSMVYHSNAVRDNLGHLCRYRMVELEHGSYRITDFGSQLLQISKSLLHFWNCRDYFIEHTTRDLPEMFSLSLGVMLNNIKLIELSSTGYGIILEEMYNQANDFIYNIIYDLPVSKEISDVLFKKLECHPEFNSKTIFGNNTLMNEKKRLAYLEKFKKFKENGQIEQKRTENIKISVFVTDNNAIIALPINNKDKPDITKVFYGKDKDFHAWCLNYFFHCWRDAGSNLQIK